MKRANDPRLIAVLYPLYGRLCRVSVETIASLLFSTCPPVVFLLFFLRLFRCVDSARNRPRVQRDVDIGILPPFFPFSGLVYQLSDSFRGFFRLRSHRSNFGHETHSRLRKQRENAQDENRLAVIACPLSPDIPDRTCPGRLSFSHVDRDLDPISSTACFNFSFSLSLSFFCCLLLLHLPYIHRCRNALIRFSDHYRPD